MFIFLLRDGPADRRSIRDSGYQTPSNGTLLYEIKSPNDGALSYDDACPNYGTPPYDNKCPPNGTLPFGSKCMVRHSVAPTENSADAGSIRSPSVDSQSPASSTSRANYSLTSSCSCSVDEDSTNSPGQSINSEHGDGLSQINSSGKRRVSLLRTEQVNNPSLNSPPIRRRRLGMDSMDATFDVESKARNSKLFLSTSQLLVSFLSLWSWQLRNSLYFLQ